MRHSSAASPCQSSAPRCRLRFRVSPPDRGAWQRQIYAFRIFDELIHNFDRNRTNLLIDTSWRLWIIDHTRAFKVFSELRSPQNPGTRCPSRLFAALRHLDQRTLETTMEELQNPTQIRGLLGRRDRIVGHFGALIAERGAAAVLFGLPSRVDGPPPAPGVERR